MAANLEMINWFGEALRGTIKGAVTIYDWDGGGRDMGGVWKIQYLKRGYKNVFHSREVVKFLCSSNRPKSIKP